MTQQGPIGAFIGDIKILHAEYREYYFYLKDQDIRHWPDYPRGNTLGRIRLAGQITNELGSLLAKLAPNLPYYEDL